MLTVKLKVERVNIVLRTVYSSLFDQSMQQHKKKKSAVIDQESLRVRVCITVTAGILMVQVHIEVADSRHPEPSLLPTTEKSHLQVLSEFTGIDYTLTDLCSSCQLCVFRAFGGGTLQCMFIKKEPCMRSMHMHTHESLV